MKDAVRLILFFCHLLGFTLFGCTTEQSQKKRCVTDVDCPAGHRCLSGECTDFDPCQEVICNQPPPPICLDQNTRRQYLSEGTCILGNCAYSHQDAACPAGCQDGYCIGDPCRGVICDRPPADACLDGQTRRHYLVPGNCLQGKCEYAYEDQNCPFGCVDGACQSCQPNWTDAGDCNCTPTACSACSGQKLQRDGCGNERYVACSKDAQGCPAGEFCYQDACCRPDCSGKECGSDGCGGSCGDCPASFSCQGSSCQLSSPCQGAQLSEGSFGFNYAVPYHVGAWYAAEWPVVQTDFQRDIKIMAALGARVVRIMLLPYYSGIRLQENQGNVGDPQALAAAKQNLVEIINRFRAEGMAVILAFGPNALYWNGPDSRRWWEWAYGADGWSRFVQDIAEWGRQLAMAIESSEACSGVLYWDLLNEADYRVPGMGELVRTLAARVPLPAEKIGISALLPSDIGPMLNDLHSQGREPAFLDIHSYPDREVNADPSQALSALRQAAPRAKTLIGEFAGIYCENGQDEDKQLLTEAQVLEGAFAADTFALLHWMLWDYADGDCSVGDSERTGLGFSHERPRDVLGALSNWISVLPGGDFEGSTSDWYPGGTGTGAEMSLGGPNEGDAATNLYYLRLTITEAGTYWLCSPAFATSGSRLYVSGFVRSNLNKITLDVHYRDAAGWNHNTSRPPLQIDIPLGGNWAFYNLQQQTGGVSFDLPSGTYQSLICFVGTGSGSGPIYLDIDTISVNLH